jgi:sugar lactone lactonase YvrE
VWHPHLRIPPANLPPLPLERLWQIGGACGSGRDQLAAPHGAAFSPAGDKLYVADTGNRRVVVYSVDGALETVLTGDALQEPVDVAVATDGTLLILDAAVQGVFRVEAGGELAPVPLQTGFYHPRGLGIDKVGNMAVADTGGGRVVIVEPGGTQAGQFGGQGSLLGRGQPVDALAAEGVLWAVSAEDGRLWNLNSGGSMTSVQPTGTVDGPQLASLADGRLLVSDPARSTFLLLAASGQPLGQFAYAGELATPTGIAATRIGDGNIIAVADTRACTLSVWRLA